MTLIEAINEIKSRGLYLLRENTFGSYDEYVAKLNDLWADSKPEGEERTIDDLLEDKWYEEIVKSAYDDNAEPTDTIDEIIVSLQGDADLAADSYEDNKSGALFALANESTIMEGKAPLLTEAWYDNVGLNHDDVEEFKRLDHNLASFKTNRLHRNDNNPRGSAMSPRKRREFYRAFANFVRKFEDAHNDAALNKLKTDYLQLLTDDGWHRFLIAKNPQMSPDDLDQFVGQSNLTPEDLEILTLDQAERRTREDERERQRREEERLQNPEPEDLVNDEIPADAPEEDVITTRPVQRRRIRTGNRHFHDTGSIETAMITINIDTTNDPETRDEAKELVNTIKERFRIMYGEEIATELPFTEPTVEESAPSNTENYTVTVTIPDKDNLPESISNAISGSVETIKKVIANLITPPKRMVNKRDENGNIVHDENGQTVKIPESDEDYERRISAPQVKQQSELASTAVIEEGDDTVKLDIPAGLDRNQLKVIRRNVAAIKNAIAGEVSSFNDEMTSRRMRDPNSVYRTLCDVDAAEVPVEDADGTQRTEYHIVIKMPAEMKEELAAFVKNEMEDVFTFVNTEHPENGVYSFETEGERVETYEEDYEYEEPVVQTRHTTRPQTTATRRIPPRNRWSVKYKVADDDGNDTGRVKWVHNVIALTKEDAMNKVENPEDIDSAYANDVFQAIDAVKR